MSTEHMTINIENNDNSCNSIIGGVCQEFTFEGGFKFEKFHKLHHCPQRLDKNSETMLTGYDLYGQFGGGLSGRKVKSDS